MRPAEVNLLLGDASKARSVLGWEELVDMMVKRDKDKYSK